MTIRKIILHFQYNILYVFGVVELRKIFEDNQIKYNVKGTRGKSCPKEKVRFSITYNYKKDEIKEVIGYKFNRKTRLKIQNTPELKALVKKALSSDVKGVEKWEKQNFRKYQEKQNYFLMDWFFALFCFSQIFIGYFWKG